MGYVGEISLVKWETFPVLNTNKGYRKVNISIRKVSHCNLILLKESITILLFVMYPIIAFCGWEDYTPRPINSDDSPGTVNPHHNSGGRRIERINNTTIAICPHQSGEERTYRSVDNGETWQEIDRGGSASGVLVSGKNQIVYYFYINNSSLYMVKFRYDQQPSEPIAIYIDDALAQTSTGVYHAVNATVGEDGTLFILTHWGDPDQLYLFTSQDEGVSWAGPNLISTGTGPWFYPHFEVTAGGVLVGTYRNFDLNDEMWFVRSEDNGLSWQRTLVSDNKTYNASLLTVGENGLFIFAQSSEANHTGLVFNQSFDLGESWDGWQLIDPTCGYADPSPALGSDGNSIYVAYRSSNGTGVESGTCGDRSRARLVMSPDLGRTWQIVDSHYNAERTGTRYQTRYQTWWNYGGPLEWTWMQYEESGTNRPIYYELNIDVNIYNQQGSVLDTAPIITSTPITVGKPGLLYTYELSASDPSVEDSLTYSLDIAPAGMSVSSFPGVINWLPDDEDVGNHNVIVRVQDTEGGFDTQSFVFQVSSDGSSDSDPSEASNESGEDTPDAETSVSDGGGGGGGCFIGVGGAELGGGRR